MRSFFAPCPLLFIRFNWILSRNGEKAWEKLGGKSWLLSSIPSNVSDIRYFHFLFSREILKNFFTVLYLSFKKSFLRSFDTISRFWVQGRLHLKNYILNAGKNCIQIAETAVGRYFWIIKKVFCSIVFEFSCISIAVFLHSETASSDKGCDTFRWKNHFLSCLKEPINKSRKSCI